MAKETSAGVLLYRFGGDGRLSVLIAHPGGPFWSKKDHGSWSIPKGLAEAGEHDLETVARREFAEEIGQEVTAPLAVLGEFRQPSGKIIHVWIGSQQVDEDQVKSNMFEMEWPPKSGKYQSFPEVDRARWCEVPVAREKMLKGQVPILEALINHLGYAEDISVSKQIAQDKGEQLKLI